MTRPRIVLLLSLFLLLTIGCQEQEPTTPTPAATQPTTESPTAVPPTDIPPTATTLPPTLAPLAVTLFTAEGALTPDQELIFEFTQPMDTSIEMPAIIRPHRDAIQTWSDDGMTLTYTPPAEGWAPVSRLRVELSEDLKSASGEPLPIEGSWSLRMKARPSVAYVQPRKQLGLEPDSVVHVIFDMRMDTASVEDALTVTLDSSGYSLAWENNDTTLVITPDESLPPLGRIGVYIASTAFNKDGILIDGERAYEFGRRPLVNGVTPPNKQEPQRPLTVSFEYPLHSAEIQLTANGQPVAGTSVYDSENQELTFTPDKLWEPDTTYTFQITNVQSPDGEPYAVPNADEFTSQPAIVYTNPSTLRGRVDPELTITVGFDRPMDQAATAAAFSLTPAVSGTVSFSDDYTLVFTPDKIYFPSNTSYTFTIDDSARSVRDEKTLTEPYVVEFATTQRDSDITFGYGARVQTLDTNSRRAIQFTGTRVLPEEINYKLYALPLENFMARQNQNPSVEEHHLSLFNVYQVQPDLFDVSKLTLVREWNGGELIDLDGTPTGGTLTEAMLPADVESGIYVLEVVLEDIVQDMLVVQMGEFGLLAKSAGDQVTAWVADPDGEPTANVTIRVYDSNNGLLVSGTTDVNGLYQTTVDGAAAVVVAEHGDSVILTGFDSNWQSGYSYWGWWGRSNNTARTMSAAVWTDRPIYRPAQKVNFKAVIRADEDAILGLPAEGTPVTVQFRDPRKNIVRTLELETNAYGAVSADFTLAEGAMLGDYSIIVNALGGSMQQIFKVQDYRKPDYRVDLSADVTRIVVGQPLTVTIDSNYFLGEPVRNAKTEVAALRGYSSYYWDFEDQSYLYNDYWYERTSSQETTDEDGQIRVTFDTSDWETDQNQGWYSEGVQRTPYLIQADVNDGSNQNVAGTLRVLVYEAGELLDFNIDNYFFRANEPIEITGSVRDIHEQPVANRQIELVVGRYRYFQLDSGEPLQTVEVVTDENGDFSGTLTLESGYGSYQVQGLLTDDFGNEVRYSRWFYIYNDDSSRWFGTSDNDFSIQADKESYSADETVQLLAETTFDGYGLLTVERGTVRREQLVRLTAPITLLELPLETTDTPNVFVSLAAWEPIDTSLVDNDTPYYFPAADDADLRIATVEIAVAPINKRLDVSIETDQQTYAPREAMTATVRVTDENGVGVSAELSLAVVDEAIFTLSEDLSRPLFEAFYYEREHGVATFDSYQPMRYLFGGGGRGGGGGDGGGEFTPRSDFPDTALWLPNIETDTNGFAIIPLTLPDSLTQFRLTARATTLTTQVGEITAFITTTQPVRVQPLLPRTVTAGDSFELSTLIQNISGEEITLALNATWDALLGEPVEPILITLAADEKRIVGWGIVAEAEGEVTLVISAAADGDVVDAVEMPLTIAPLAVLDAETWVGTLQGDAIFEQNIEKPADALPSSTIEIDLSRSIAGTILEGLEYLTGYPYGCVEQTMSRALPNAVVSRAFTQLGVAGTDPELDEKINASLQRLYGFQHSDGGWGWWYSDPSDHYQSAWVLFGLALIQDADYEVSAEVINNAVSYLQNALPSMDVRTRAYALYSLSLVDAGELESMRGLLDAELDLFSKTALTLAFANSGDVAQAETLLAEIVDRAAISATSGNVSWNTGVGDGYYERKTMASRVRTTAFILSAMSQLDPDNELMFGTVQFLMSRRKQNGWGTTNETSYAILGLSDYLIALQMDEEYDTTYTVEIDGEVVAEGVLDRDTVRGTVVISAENLPTSGILTIHQSGDKPLYYIVNQRDYLAREVIDSAGTINVTRTYRSLENDADQTEFTEGELIEVTLELSSDEPVHYLLIEDALPGGLEPLNEELDNVTVGSADGSYDPYNRPRREYTYREIHGDRVTFFLTQWDADGTLTLSYRARATRTGEFVALPTIAEAMYNPAQWGRSDSHAISVRQ